MGRQIAIVATNSDEESFLEFVRTTADIAIFASAAPNRDQLWVARFAEDRSLGGQYRIWNKAFPWVPEYGRVESGETAGWYYVSNCWDAPVVEFSRSRGTQHSGRLYWAKDFAAPNGLSYNVTAFNVWFETLVRWIRKHGVRKDKGKLEPYFLPEALAAES